MLQQAAASRAILAPVRISKLYGYQVSLRYSSNRPKIDQMAMGQSAKGKKHQGRGLLFGIHPAAILAVCSLFYGAWKVIIEPAWENGAIDMVLDPKTYDYGVRFSPHEIAEFPFHTKTVVFVLGGPGSGKGTNSAKLVEDFGFVHLSAGDLLRAEQERPMSEYGALIKQYIINGWIVPHEITVKLLRKQIMQHPGHDLFLIDGFPRNIEQAKVFEDTLCVPKKVLYFECPEEKLLERLLERGKTSGRSDDNAESIKKRFHTYFNTSKPVIDDYTKQGKVIKISCMGSKDDVYAKTKKQMAAFIKAEEKEREKLKQQLEEEEMEKMRQQVKKELEKKIRLEEEGKKANSK
ncbi:bifunctional uridylate/adenylate kinase [Coemansia sp. RSA 1933]|nr:bifunctional uridylate/adenylate kinase [Coemansia sp. RSA 1933]